MQAVKGKNTSLEMKIDESHEYKRLLLALVFDFPGRIGETDHQQFPERKQALTGCDRTSGTAGSLISRQIPEFCHKKKV